MSQNISDTIENVICSALEEAAFVFVEVAETPPPFSGQVVEGTVEFQGPKSGSLVFSATAQFGQDLAANFLGVDADDPDAAHGKLDALGEILNIVSGAFLSELFGAESDYKMSCPKLVEMTDEAHETHMDGAQTLVSFVTEEGYRIDAAVIDGI